MRSRLRPHAHWNASCSLEGWRLQGAGAEVRPRPGEGRRTMGTALATYRTKIMDRICATCVDRNADGSCGLDPALECEVEKHLPEMLALVKGVTSDRIGDYVERLRQNVCRVCNETDGDGICGLRARVDCTLDRY